MAGGPGFEPRLPGSEPGVLPLNYPPSATPSTFRARSRRSASACKALLQHRPGEKGLPSRAGGRMMVDCAAGLGSPGPDGGSLEPPHARRRGTRHLPLHPVPRRGGTGSARLPRRARARPRLCRARPRNQQLPPAHRRSGARRGPRGWRRWRRLPSRRQLQPHRAARRRPRRDRPFVRKRHGPRRFRPCRLRGEARAPAGARLPRGGDRGVPPGRERPRLPRPRGSRDRPPAARHLGAGGSGVGDGELRAAAGSGRPPRPPVRHRRRQHGDRLDQGARRGGAAGATLQGRS